MRQKICSRIHHELKDKEMEITQLNLQREKIKKERTTSSQDGQVGQLGAHQLPRSHQNHNYIIEQH